MRRSGGRSRRRLEEALSLLRQAREHFDSRGSLDSEGRTLVAKAIKLLKREGIYVNWKEVRKWDEEALERLVSRAEDSL
ncbi:MAG: hypothetical protein GXO07_02620 [Crenarchaeota archaeon]|nr:hypothetical protein [Thermoproteota archaeon]